MIHFLARLALVLLTCSLIGTAAAEQRALLVGVGKYAVPGIDLPGIDLDLERMNDTLNLMGFDDSQIHKLLDSQATSKNVIREFEGWLRKGVRPEDRVVFYFSGHGSNTPDLDGDETDGVDEVLVTHDVRRIKQKGRSALKGVVTDDKMASLIGNIASENIWIIVDACHSGTVTRDIQMDNLSLGADPVFVKSFSYDGMPVSNEFAFDRSLAQDGPANFVSISAAGDGEKAIGTHSGGVFTIGLTKTITEFAKTGSALTITQLRDRAAEYIRGHVDESRLHHPQITGNESLASGALKIIPGVSTSQPNRNRLTGLVAEQKNTFQLEASKNTYVLGDNVKLSMNVPIDGYLNVVTVDAQDNATVLFPNRFNASNFVKEGPVKIPTDAMAFDLPASEPVGPTLVAAFVTRDPINFYEQTLDDRDENGNVNVTFTTLSHTATRAIRVAPRKEDMYAVAIELSVVAEN